MPHTSHRKKPPRAKRTHVVDEDGWTRVTNENSSSRAPRPVSYENSDEQRAKIPMIQYNVSIPVKGMTIDLLYDQFQKVEEKWLESTSWKALKAILENKIDRKVIENIRETIVFGTGSYCGIGKGWIERFEVSLYQLAAFKAVLDTIEVLTGSRPLSKAQEPVYNELDAQLLTRLGIEQVDHPVGLQSLSSSSFAFAPCAELSVEMSCLEPNPSLVMLTGKLDHHWRNEKGKACTNRILSPHDELGNVGSTMNDNNSGKSQTPDILERQLQILEAFLHDKDTFALPDLDVKDFPFSDVHVFAKRTMTDLAEDNL